MKRTNLPLFAYALMLLAVYSCGSNSAVKPTSSTEVPAVYKKIYGALDLYVSEDYVYIKSNGRPDHKSPYYKGTQWESTLYQAYNGDNANFDINPNHIINQSFTFKLPLYPQHNNKATATPLGPIGIALNGVPFYNQYAGPNQPLTTEINSFDQFDGHPQQTGQYHYHAEPYYLTTTKGKDALLGFLLDGFPVYGPLENGKVVLNTDLDAYHGHSHATTDFPGGIYHYHITSTDPYINGNGFYGTPGTVTQ